jgi:hypothetical protein
MSEEIDFNDIKTLDIKKSKGKFKTFINYRELV